MGQFFAWIVDEPPHNQNTDDRLAQPNNVSKNKSTMLAHNGATLLHGINLEFKRHVLVRGWQRRFNFRRRARVENILQTYDKDINRKNESSVVKALEYIMRNIRRRMIIIIVTDMEGKRAISEQLLKRLVTMHDVLFLNISDTDAFGDNIYDVESFKMLPDFFTKDKKENTVKKNNETQQDK